MSTFKTQQLIADLHEQTEIILQKAISEWQTYSAKILLFKQTEDSWSAVQCLMHLNSYGCYYLPAIQKSIAEGETKHWLAEETYTDSFFGNWFTQLMKPKGEEKTIKKMKAPKAHTPVTNENSDVVLAEFIEQQETLLKLLEQARNVDLRKARTPISISKFLKLPLGDTLRFVIAHNERHVLQAERSMAIAKNKAVVVQ